MRATLVVVLVGVAVCGCGDPKPIVEPGQMIAAGDTTFRTHDGGAIEVAVVRDFEGKSATGVATLHGLTLEQARRSPLVRVAVARAWLTIAAGLSTDPSLGYRATRRAINELGTAYRDARPGGRHITDDTGQQLLLAESRATAGDLAGALRIASDVLQGRIGAYLSAFRGSVE